MAVKTCPECVVTVQQCSLLPSWESSPRKRNGELSAKVVNDACGFPIRAYECPNCHFVELYREMEAVNPLEGSGAEPEWLIMANAESKSLSGLTAGTR
jgi:hypothetical protein